MHLSLQSHSELNDTIKSLISFGNFHKPDGYKLPGIKKAQIFKPSSLQTLKVLQASNYFFKH